MGGNTNGFIGDFEMGNDQEIRANTVSKYRELYEQYGVDERSLGWTKNKQQIRFAQMFDKLDIINADILDIGCGFGDLLKYLRRRDPDETFGYVGIDIVPEFVEVAKEKNPEYRFLNEDIFEYEPFRKFKYVVECGCFTGLDPQHEDESYAFVEKFIGRMLELCTDDGAVVCHFLSDKVDYRTFATDFHIAPEKILAIAYKFSRRVVLDNSVLPFEACLTIYKDDSFRPETTVFNQAKID